MIIDSILLSYSALIVILIIVVTFYSNTNNTNANDKKELKLPNLSVVIPFKNESENLSQLLLWLNKQKYPGNVELILVNDNSTDDSVEVVKRNLPYCKKTVKIVNNLFNPDAKLTSKQQAIETGIRSAQNEFIVLTDADMCFENDWLFSLAKEAAAGADLVFGHTAIRQDGFNCFTYLQTFQLEFLFSTALALFHTGLTGSCMGNNLLVSRTEYLSLGGQSTIGYTIVEDRALFALFKKNKKKCAHANPFTAKAFTNPCASFSQFYHQMRRWAIGGFSTSFGLLFVGVIFAFQNMVFSLLPLKVFSLHSIIITITNFALTWAFTSICFYKMRSKINALLFPVFFMFMIIESLIFAISLIISPSVKWKGHILRK